MQQRNLVGLPNDVLQLIVQVLTIEPLFTPRYTDEDFGYHGDLSEYTAKCKEYYGAEKDRQDQCAQGLISWSASCKHFRRFLTPHLFKTVVLRDTSKSIASVQCLSATTYWNDIRHLIFATNYDESELKKSGSGSDDGADENTGSAGDRAEDLSRILSHLPPNLLSLILDLPEGADNIWEDALMQPGQYDGGLEISSYRLALRNILNSVSKNDVSKNLTFDLKLYNVSPYHSLAYDSTSWKTFLSNVTSFTLGLKYYDNGAGWKMNLHLPAIDFAPRLGEYFFDNLERVQSFHLHCDESWPLGGPNALMHPLELPLPSTRTWHDLRHVTFNQTFIGTQMKQFLLSHRDTLETIELIDCFAPDPESSMLGDDTDDCVSWQSFFEDLADAKPSRLRDVRISCVLRSEDNLLNGYEQSTEEEERKQEVKQILRQQEEALKQVENDNERASAEERQKKLLAYCDVDDKYGMLFEAEETISSRFIDGEDHNEWLRLVDLMQRNRKSVNT